MDILINKHISYNDLQKFLKQYSPSNPFFLLYQGKNEWDDVPVQTDIFQYTTEGGNGFVQGITVYSPKGNDLAYLERLAYTLANAFNCQALCDASRLLLENTLPYYSLLFEEGFVYLVHDYDLEATGQVQKIIALTYAVPDS